MIEETAVRVEISAARLLLCKKIEKTLILK